MEDKKKICVGRQKPSSLSSAVYCICIVCQKKIHKANVFTSVCIKACVCVCRLYILSAHVLVCNFWTILYLHDNMVLMWVPFLTFPHLGEACELPCLSFSQHVT